MHFTIVWDHAVVLKQNTNLCLSQRITIQVGLVVLVMLSFCLIFNFVLSVDHMLSILVVIWTWWFDQLGKLQVISSKSCIVWTCVCNTFPCCVLFWLISFAVERRCSLLSIVCSLNLWCYRSNLCPFCRKLISGRMDAFC